jgi:hypothetical protein
MRRVLLTMMVPLGIGTAPGTAASQIRLDVGPYVGIYAATASFGSAPFASPIPLPASSRHGMAAVVGAKSAIWVGQSIGLGLQWGTASSTVRTRDEASREMENPGRVSVSAVQLLVPLQVEALQGRGQAYLSGGVGLLQRSGEFYEAYDQVKNVAGVVGLGSKFAIAGPAHVTLDFESYLYSLQLQQPGTSFDSQFQADLLARVGVVLGLGSHDDDAR